LPFFQLSSINSKASTGCGEFLCYTQRVMQAKLIVYRTKPMVLFNQGTWVVGQLELIQQTKSLTDFRAASFTAPW